MYLDYTVDKIKSEHSKYFTFTRYKYQKSVIYIFSRQNFIEKEKVHSLKIF